MVILSFSNCTFTIWQLYW